MSLALLPDMPRERLIAYGGERVTTVELLAVILGTGTRGRSAVTVAQQIMGEVGGLARLAEVPPRELVSIPGIGVARAARIAASFQLSRRAMEAQFAPSPTIEAPADVYGHLQARMAGLTQEVFVVLALDARNGIIGEFEVARGTLSHVEVHPREVFRPLIRHSAATAVIAHNHPSGDPEPSPEDVAVTHRLRAVGEIVGIPIVDHVILGEGRYVSMCQRLELV